MTREEIIDLAHATDLLDEQHYGSVWADRIVEFANWVAAHEREQCAMVCDDYINTFRSKRYSASYMESYPERFAAGLCAEGIRKRGEK